MRRRKKLSSVEFSFDSCKGYLRFFEGFCKNLYNVNSCMTEDVLQLDLFESYESGCKAEQVSNK